MDEDQELEKLLNIQLKAATRLRDVVELSGWRLGSPHMQAAVALAAQAALGGLMVGAQRYIFHLPTLATVLQSPLSVRPTLRLSRGLLRLQLELGDLTTDWRATTLAVQLVGGRRRCVASSRDLLGWTQLLATQDRALRELEEQPLPTSSLPKAVARTIRPPTQQVHHRIMVLLCDNSMAATCVAAAALLARPGVDSVQLVSVVANQAGRTDALAFLAPHTAALRDAGIRAEAIVECKEHAPTTEVVGAAMARAGTSLLVLGSVALVAGSSSAGHTQLVPDSFALFALHTFHLPTLVVTPRCKLPAPGAGSGKARPPLRSLVLVQGHSRPLLHYLCGLLSPGGQGPNDLKLYLAQVYNPKTCSTALGSSLRLLAEKFSRIAEGHSMGGATPCRLDPPLDTALVSAVKQYMLHLLAVQLPSDLGHDAAGGARFLPAFLLSVIRSSAVPVLIYPRRHADIQHAAIPQGLSAMLRSSKVFMAP